MPSRATLALGSSLAIAISAVACSGPRERASASSRAALTSVAAKFLELRFTAEVIAPKDASAREAIVAQLMYTQGILMSRGEGNAQVGNVQVDDVHEEPTGDTKRVAYAATLPVAWPKDEPAPDSYELTLPLDATRFDAFNAKYDGRCGSAEEGRASFVFAWDPKARGCAIDARDVAVVSAKVTPSARETANRYPEYDLIWEDGRLDVVALFGLIETNTPQDYGHLEAQSFAEHVRRSLDGATIADNGSGSWIRSDTTITGKVDFEGRARDVKVDVIVTKNLMHAGAEFDERYDPLSERADLVFYNGHSQLGEAVEAFAHRGRVAPGKYQLVLVDGCQSFAYLGATMTDRRRQANGETDPSGTRYLDVVTNALPNPVSNAAEMSSILFDAAIEADEPRSYRDLLRTMPEEQMVVVVGEEDNRFAPEGALPTRPSRRAHVFR